MRHTSLTVFFILFLALAAGAQVGISNGNNTPDPSAQVDISSISKGLLIPRMTRAERDQIPAPQTSLLIFQTNETPGYYYNSGTPGQPVWKKLTVGGEVPVPDGSETKVTAGANTWVTGTGTTANPYIINATGGGGPGGFTHYIGELYQGGIVVYVWKDNTGAEHGLIASLTDLNGTIGKYSQWSNVSGYAGTWSNYDGEVNTLAIISQPGHVTSAAQLCADYSNDGYSDWYLPSAFELNLVYQAGYVVNNVLGGSTDKLTGDPGYWTSVEYLNDTGLYLDFLMGPGSYPKNYYNMVRAVRRF